MIWEFTYQRLFLAFFKAASNVVSSTGYSLSCLKGLRFAKATRKLYYSSRINPNKVSPSGFLIIRWGVFFFLFFFEIRLYFQVFFQIRKKKTLQTKGIRLYFQVFFLVARTIMVTVFWNRKKKKQEEKNCQFGIRLYFQVFFQAFFLFPLSFFSFLSLRREMGKTIPEMESAYIFRFSSKSTSQGKSAYIFRFSFPLFVSRSLPFLFSQNNGYHRGESFFASVWVRLQVFARLANSVDCASIAHIRFEHYFSIKTTARQAARPTIFFFFGLLHG